MRYCQRRDDIYELIAKNIKEKRNNKKMTQAQLAEKSGYSHVTIRKIEAYNINKHISLETLCNIAEALEVEVSDLLKNNREI